MEVIEQISRVASHRIPERPQPVEGGRSADIETEVDDPRFARVGLRRFRQIGDAG
jgi:hypothetical protein